MVRRASPTLFAIATVSMAVILLCPPRARADEEDDIQRQIESQKAGVTDLEHLDTRHGAAIELQHLREWLGEAWDLRNKHDPDGAREVLDRCLAQAELVRQVIAATQATGDVAVREAKLQRTRQEIERQKRALRDAETRKKALDQATRP